MENIKEAVKQVAKESRKGNARSRKIIQELAPSTFELLHIADEEENTDKKSKK